MTANLRNYKERNYELNHKDDKIVRYNEKVRTSGKSRSVGSQFYGLDPPETRKHRLPHRFASRNDRNRQLKTDN